MSIGRNASRYVAGLALVALAAAVASAVRPDSVEFPEAARSFTFALDRRSDHLWIGVRSQQPKPSQLTVVLADSQASFIHPGRTAVYRLALGGRRTTQGVRIDVDPPAAVARVAAAAERPRTPELDWQPASPPLMLPPPRPASTDLPTAEASVDETDTYGLRLFGVPVRARPQVDAVLVATASHGQRLQATCWTIGDVVTNGFATQSAGAYTSDVWFRVVTERGPGFIPDVRFGRRGDSDRLNLSMCAD